MKLTFYACDKCGKVLRNMKGYSIQAFQGDKEDGKYTLCRSCYCEVTDAINEMCEQKGFERIRDFQTKYNEQFGVDNGK